MRPGYFAPNPDTPAPDATRSAALVVVPKALEFAGTPVPPPTVAE
jgi:hypothetical protein